MPVRLIQDADWVLKTMDEEYFLTNAEYDLIKRAALADKKLIWFKDLTINIAYIITIEPIVKTRTALAERVEYSPEVISDAQLEKNRKRIAKMKKDLLTRSYKK